MESNDWEWDAANNFSLTTGSIYQMQFKISISGHIQKFEKVMETKKVEREELDLVMQCLADKRNDNTEFKIFAFSVTALT